LHSAGLVLGDGDAKESAEEKDTENKEEVFDKDDLPNTEVPIDTHVIKAVLIGFLGWKAFDNGWHSTQRKCRCEQ
jgi:hypothetical protein